MSSLRVLCLSHFAKSFYEPISSSLVDWKNPSWEDITEQISDAMNPFVDALPADLFPLFIRELQHLSPTIAFITSIVYSDRLDTISLAGSGTMGNFTPSIPLAFLSSTFSVLSSNVTKLDIPNTVIDDGILLALSESPAKSSIKHIRALGLGLTDACLACLMSFENLELLSLGHCPGIGLPTFMSIAECPTLTTVEVWNSVELASTVLGIFLAPGALPGLRALTVGGAGATSCGEDALETVKQMRDPHRLERLQIRDIEENSAVDAIFEKILEICPNLQFDLSGRAYVPTYLDFPFDPTSSGSIKFQISLWTESDLNNLVTRFEHLEHLVIDGNFESASVDLSGLAMLQRLELFHSMASSMKIKALPASIRKLTAIWQDSQDQTSPPVPQEDIDAFFAMLARCCRNMRNIVFIGAARAFVSKQHLEAMFTSMSYLETFNPSPSGFSGRRSAPVSWPFHHPSLVRMSHMCTTDGFVPVPTRAASLEYLSVENFIVESGTKVFASALSQVGSTSPSVTIADLVKTLPQSHIKHMTLVATSMSIPSITEVAPRLRDLTSLTLQYEEVTATIAAEILRCLPSLASLEITLEPGINDWSWLTHKRLSKLEANLENMEDDSRASKALGKPAAVLRLDSERLPLLADFKLHFAMHPTYNIRVQGLQQLTTLNLIGGRHVNVGEPRSYDVVVEDCPLLSELHLGALKFGKLGLRQLPLLTELQFYNCIAPECLDDVGEGVDHLRILTVFAFQAPDTAEAFDPLRDLFKAKENYYQPVQYSVHK